MKFEQALNDARDDKLIARADWPASRALALQLHWRVGEQVRASGYLATLTGQRYLPADDDLSAEDWLSAR